LWFKQGSKGPKRKLMPKKYRKIFANKIIVCLEFQKKVIMGNLVAESAAGHGPNSCRCV